MKQETPSRKKYASERAPRRLTSRNAEALAHNPTESTGEPPLLENANDQQRRQAVLAGLIARAQVLVPDPPDSPTRKACRESPIDDIVTEKFRRQGFNL